MAASAMCIIKLGPWEFMCRDVSNVVVDDNEFHVEMPVSAPTLKSSKTAPKAGWFNVEIAPKVVKLDSKLLAPPPKAAQETEESSSASTGTPEPESEAEEVAGGGCAGDDDEAANDSPLTRWFSASSSLDGWSVVEKGSADADVSAEAAATAAVDLSGDWVLDRTEGPMEDLMADAGVSWAVRRMARGANFGVGIVGQKIVQKGDAISIEFKTFQTCRTAFRAGAGEYDAVGEDGLPIVVNGRWEGSSLLVEGVFKDGGAPLQKSRRYLEGDEMVHEAFALAGFSAKRIFRRA
eukprot:TRINITY_DN6464_c0_g1_i1.p1 TRINITY_DN6464_c0_g1~~TRINITY_DN6464_c0_g1_i1.p1  ORF type:complete len:329 (-),score=75.06 TRINITY_DN6464_c0_g1_i1:567-1445(-)